MASLEDYKTPDRIPTSIGSMRIVIRQYHVRDAEELSKLLSGSFPNHLEPWSPPSMKAEALTRGKRAAREHILAALDRWEDGIDYRFFITLRSSGEIIGEIALNQVVRGVSQSCFIGYWIGLPYIRQGFATEAVVLAMEFAFEHLHLHRVAIWIATENSISLKIPARLGLRFEGTLERALFLGEVWRDHHAFGITIEEWRERKSELRTQFAP